MKVKLIIISIILLLVMVFACGCIPFMEKLGILTPPAEEQLSPEKGGPPDGLVKVLIGFKQKPGPPEQALVKGFGGKIKYTYHLVPAIAASVPEVAIEALQKNPNVTQVEFDSMVYAIDGELDNSWGVKRIGAGFVHEFGNKGAGVKIAVIDTGIDYNHPDLDGNYIGGYDFVNSDDDPMDDEGHGTHVAGIVAAEDNGFGVVGVAPMANLYALKVLDSKGSGSYSDVIAALQWCVDNKIQITNNSYGSSGDPGYTVKAAFDNSYNNGNGVLHVAAAGNSGNSYGVGDNIIYPARYDSVIAVAATDKSDKRASWSSTGPDLELSAPGVAINSTLLGGGYGEKSGTSMASPHVAGTAALVIAAARISDVRGQLQSTADDLGATGWDSKYGYGLVDADEAAGVESPPPKYDLIVDILPEAAETAGASTSPTTGTYTDYAAAGDSVTVVASDPSDGSWTFVNWTIGVDVKSTFKSYTFNMPAADVTIVANFEAVPPPVTGIMHVSIIDMSLKKVAINVNAIATVTIVDANAKPVGGATVYGHWSGATSDVDSGVTNASGIVSLESNKVRKPKSGTKFIFTVDNVKKDGWTYDSSGQTSNSITY